MVRIIVSMCLIKLAMQQKRTIGSDGSDDGLLDRPDGLFIKGDVMYVNADSWNHSILTGKD